MSSVESAKVAVVIVAWNNKDILVDCIESAQEQTYPFVDIILIDNDSADGTAEFIEAKYPKVHLLRGGSNLGFAKGNNVAIQYAQQIDGGYNYYVLLNSDARLRQDWVQTMVEFAQTKPTGALFQSTTLDYYDIDVIDSTHIYVSSNGQGTQGNWREPNIGEKGPLRVFGVNAAACMISRNFIEAQPFDYIFDEKMFMYLEDVDLSARATVLGWDNYLVPGTEAFHMGSASSGKNPGFSLYLTFRNNVAMLLKNYPFWMIVRMSPHIFRADYYTIKHLIKTGRGKASLKVIKGRFVGFIRLPMYFSDIRVMAKHRVIDHEYLRVLMQKGYL